MQRLLARLTTILQQASKYSGLQVKGWVKGKQGEYHDALFNKNNRVEIVLHEHLGGGFSPPFCRPRANKKHETIRPIRRVTCDAAVKS